MLVCLIMCVCLCFRVRAPVRASVCLHIPLGSGERRGVASRVRRTWNGVRNGGWRSVAHGAAHVRLHWSHPCPTPLALCGVLSPFLPARSVPFRYLFSAVLRSPFAFGWARYRNAREREQSGEKGCPSAGRQARTPGAARRLSSFSPPLAPTPAFFLRDRVEAQMCARAHGSAGASRTGDGGITGNGKRERVKVTSMGETVIEREGNRKRRPRSRRSRGRVTNENYSTMLHSQSVVACVGERRARFGPSFLSFPLALSFSPTPQGQARVGRSKLRRKEDEEENGEKRWQRGAGADAVFDETTKGASAERTWSLPIWDLEDCAASV